MGRKPKYRSQEEAQRARQEQRLQRSLMPGAREARCEQNRKAYAKRKVVKIAQALSEVELSEFEYNHVYKHHSTIEGSLAFPDATITDTDFRSMTGHPPYPSHIVNFPSFEKDWPIISAAFHGYVTRNYVLEQERWIDEAVNRDWTSLHSELTKQYHEVMGDWEQFRNEVREHGEDPTSLPTEFIAFQNQLWTSRRLMWLKADLENLKEGTNTLFSVMRSRLENFE